jgi:putative Mg2+ transporter-C (MgtC) family protein
MPDDPGLLDAVTRLGLALVLALPVGWVHERRFRSAGVRTYALVSTSVCGFLLLALRTAGGMSEQADAFYAVLVGIAFVGSGAIVKSPEHAGGMRTAVTVWVTGAIGAGVAYGSPLISAAVSLMSALALCNRRLSLTKGTS